MTFKSCVSRATEAGNAIALATNDWQTRKRNDSPRMGSVRQRNVFRRIKLNVESVGASFLYVKDLWS